MPTLSRIIFSALTKLQRRESQVSKSVLSCRTLQTSHTLNSFPKNYKAILRSIEGNFERKFPAAAKFLQEVRAGVRYFKNDFVLLMGAMKKARLTGYESMTSKELKVYSEMPRELVRTAPVLFVGLLVPFGGVIFIVAYYFPRYMLTHHFWTSQQTICFTMDEHRKKLKSYSPVFLCLQKEMSSVSEEFSRNLHKVFESLSNGHPTVHQILSIKPLFEKAPYGLSYLHTDHKNELLRMHGLHTGWMKVRRLNRKASFIKSMDMAIEKEGIETLTQREIMWNCFLRGLNPVNVKPDYLLVWLRAWLKVSKQVNECSYSLLLHCPLFLAFNQPSNKSVLKSS